MGGLCLELVGKQSMTLFFQLSLARGTTAVTLHGCSWCGSGLCGYLRFQSSRRLVARWGCGKGIGVVPDIGRRGVFLALLEHSVVCVLFKPACSMVASGQIEL